MMTDAEIRIEVVKIRKYFGFSSKKMSELMGISDQTFRNK